MYLIVTEKHSVAQSIAKVLNCNGRQDGYLESNDYLVSWCVGHLIELAEPENYSAYVGMFVDTTNQHRN